MSLPRFYASLDHLAEVHLRGRSDLLQQRRDYEELARDIHVRGRIATDRAEFYRTLVANNAGQLDPDYSADEERNRDYLVAAVLIRDLRRLPCPECGDEHLPGCPLAALVDEWDAHVLHLDRKPAARHARPHAPQHQLSLF